LEKLQRKFVGIAFFIDNTLNAAVYYHLGAYGTRLMSAVHGSAFKAYAYLRGLDYGILFGMYGVA
jgi:hypothetical protein